VAERDDGTRDGAHDATRDESAGGPEAWPDAVWTHLIEWLRPAVRRAARDLGFPPDTAEDAVQEALTRLLSSQGADGRLRDMAEEAALGKSCDAVADDAFAVTRAWLLRVATRLLADVRRGALLFRNHVGFAPVLSWSLRGPVCSTMDTSHGRQSDGGHQ